MNPFCQRSLDGFTFDPVEAPNGYAPTEVWNNLLWTPNFTPSGEAGPVIPDGIFSAGVFGPAPLYWGKRQEQADGTVWTNEEYKTPADASILPVIPETSALVSGAEVNTASGVLAAATDWAGNICPEAPAPGAVQPRRVSLAAG